MYECKNRKSDEFWEFGRKNHAKQSSGSKDMCFESFQGQNGLFRRFWGNFEIFVVVGGSWRKRQGLLQSLVIFREFFVEFWRA
jgi:hypothetical protein